MHIVLDKLPSRQRNRPLKDYAGQRFNRLLAIRLIEREPVWNDHLWLFRCDCGNEPSLRIKSVRIGHTKSCGCLHSEGVAARNTTHGLSRAYGSEFRIWKGMRARCSNPRHNDFKLYGGRGISVCDRWSDFAAFVEDMGPRPAGLSIDRINVNGNYEPGNCRWATAKEQANNKRNSRGTRVRDTDGEGVRAALAAC